MAKVIALPLDRVDWVGSSARLGDNAVDFEVLPSIIDVNWGGLSGSRGAERGVTRVVCLKE